MIPGCDIVVESASTIGIEAACQRKPVVDFFTPDGLANLERQTRSTLWPPVELGAALAVDRAEALVGILKSLASSSLNLREMRKNQAIIFPSPREKGAAAKIIANVLRGL